MEPKPGQIWRVITKSLMLAVPLTAVLIISLAYKHNELFWVVFVFGGVASLIVRWGTENEESKLYTIALHGTFVFCWVLLLFNGYFYFFD